MTFKSLHSVYVNTFAFELVLALVVVGLQLGHFQFFLLFPTNGRCECRLRYWGFCVHLNVVQALFLRSVLQYSLCCWRVTSRFLLVLFVATVKSSNTKYVHDEKVSQNGISAILNSFTIHEEMSNHIADDAGYLVMFVDIW